MIKLNFVDYPVEIKQGVSIFEKQLNYKLLSEGINVYAYKKDSELNIKADEKEILIFYSETSEFFRGLSIVMYNLKQGRNVFEINENRHFKTCGVMIDVSRNAVLKVDTVKDILRKMALMGLNNLMLYTEDIFKMEKYPYFGYMRGAYTKDEIKEMDRYAKIFGIEMVPCIQTLAHLGSTLKWSYANEIKDMDDILLIDEPKTYEFIEEMIKTASECYSSRKIHIGMDEANGVGFGQYFKKHGYVDKFDLLSRHVNKVIQILNKYELEPMMWSDMFFRLGSKRNVYYDVEAVMPDDISKKIPQNLSMVFWDYYHENEDMYRSMIKAHKQMGRNIVFAGGIWTWNGVSLNYNKTFASTKAALSVCREENIENVFATLWGDDGAECSIYTALLGMQLYAEYNYYDNVSEEHLSKMFKICTGYDMDAFLLFDIDKFDQSITEGDSAIAVSKQVLYQDILQGLLDKNFEMVNLKNHYKENEEKLLNINSQNDLNYIFDYQKQLVHVLYEKCDLGISIGKAYKNNDKAKLMEYEENLKVLAEDITELHNKLSEIWYKNNKAFGLDRLDLRFGGLIMRINRARDRIIGYLNGEIDNIEELDEEKLLFSGIAKPFINDYFSKRFMTVSQ